MLLSFLALVVVIFATLGIGVNRSEDAAWSPNLALDLEGGTQLILQPIATDGSQITNDDINQAIEIIRQRVDASGVAEAEISSQGGSSIVVALPGQPSQETLDLVKQSAQMRFRAFLAEGNGGQIDPAQVQAELDAAEDAETDPAEGAEVDGELNDETATEGDSATEGEGSEAEGASEDDATMGSAEDAATTLTVEEAAEIMADFDGDGTISDQPSTEPTGPTDRAWITEAVMHEFYLLDCSLEENLIGGGGDDPDAPLVACSRDGVTKYILGPMQIPGTDITSSEAGLATVGSAVSNNWVVSLNFNSEGADIFEQVTRDLATQEMISAGMNRFAIVMDGLVVSAPSVDTVIPNGEAQISGPAQSPFTREEAMAFANQLNFGSLPLNFEVQNEEQISATLGSEQLRNGLIAGAIGLVLVAIYSLFQYRGLAVITLSALIISAALTYGVITLLSWLQGYRLSLAGVAGLIVAIGFIADSFIVYFERVRDEVREGRHLDVAVDQGWLRARRTIIASDAVNLLAAVVLYFLSVGSVRGFAFTLGLTTVIDLIVVFGFTHPVLQILIRTKFFGEGHRFSGLAPEQLGARRATVYRGRGKVRSPEERLSIAERRQRERQQELAQAEAEAAPTASSPETASTSEKGGNS